MKTTSRAVRMAVLTVVLTVAVVLFLGARAETQLPKQGKAQTRHAFSAEVQRHEFGKDKLVISDSRGVMTNKAGEGIFHNMSSRCIAVSESATGSLFAYCTLTDLDGDQIFGRFERPGGAIGEAAARGRGQLTGGTGKYQGITGTATYANTGLKSTAPSIVHAYSDAEFEYRLP